MLKYLAITFLFITSVVNAGELSNKISSFVENLMPGEGTTEVSIDIRDNYKPDYSILLVRELMKSDTGNLFTQFSLINTEKLNDERIVANIGLGKRILSNDNLMMTGFNTFLDADEDGNLRASLGGEVRNAVLGFRTNYYKGIQDANGEIVLDGYDVDFSSQIPFLYWADASLSSYKWDGVNREDIKGYKIGTDLQLSPSVAVEAAWDDKDKKGMEDEYYVNLMFAYPPREGPNMINDGIGSSAWKEDRDMTSELISKVKRQNKIVVEFNVTTTISRLN